jgi:1-acyl-sn-glycerol-3-phosphate acyltransferase
MTSLFAAAKPAAGEENVAPDAVVQTLAVVYTRMHGLPLDRTKRPAVAWYGDMEMRGHAWSLLKSGPLDVVIKVGDPVPLASFADRKALARHSEAQVRENVVRILRARPADAAITVTAPETVPAPVRVRKAAEQGQKWT